MNISWSLIFYTLFVGLGAGTFTYVAILDWQGKGEKVRIAGSLTALLAMAIGGLSSALHLGHVERVANVLANPASRISQELILVISTGILIVLYLIMLVAKSPSGIRKVVGGLGLISSVALAFMTGLIYVLPARPAWNTILWPLMYIASAGVLGMFTMYVLAVYRKSDTAEIIGVNNGALIVLGVQILLIIGYLIFLAATKFPDPSRSPVRLMFGDLALLFWGGLVVIGLAIPAALTLWLRSSKDDALRAPTVAVVGFVCSLAGAIALRVILYHLGTSIEQFL